MAESINLNNFKVFRISDLIGGLSPRKNVDNNENEGDNKRSRRTRNTNKNIMLEASSFKMSNKIAVHGNKPKKSKQSANTRTDVLWLHEIKMKYFQDLQDVELPKKKKELDMLLARCDPTEENRKIAVLRREIKAIENKEEEKEYIQLTSGLVEEYKQMLQNEDGSHLERDTSGAITKFIGKYDNVEKQRITEEYCRILNNGMMINTKKLKFDNTVCTHCGGETQSNQGFISCVECGLSSEKSVHDFQLSYNDYQEISMKNIYSYKRINRFNEILATLQAKENSEIPEFVMNAVQKEIEKEQNIEVGSINNKKVRNYLKRLSLTNYYEHIPHILNKINGIPPIQIPIEVEEKLREMFKDIQEPFENVKKVVCPSRISFLSYNFVLYKFCELLDLEEYQKCFTLLKSIEKLRLQDKIWKGICEILDWEYIPSI